MPPRFRLPLAALLLLAGCSLNPILIGQIYLIPLLPQGACQPFGLRFLVNAQHEVSGSLSRGWEPAFATLSGTLNPDGSFIMNATGTGGAGNATLTGRFTSGLSTIAINGPAAGPGCDGQTYRLYLGQYLRYFGGGGGGGYR